MEKNTKLEIVWISCIYLLAYGLMPLNNGIFWDDWVLYNMSPEIIVERMRQAGNVGVGYYHSFLLSFNKGILFYRLVVFSSFLISAILFNEVLKQVKELKPSSRFFIVIFYAIFPVNSARVALINSPSAIFVMVFFLGFWLATKYMETKITFIRVLALFILYLSFFTKSLLVFYFVVLIYIFYSEKPGFKPINLFKHVLRYSDFYMMPILFWIMRKIFFQPHGLYEGYNSLKINEITINDHLFKAFNSSFIAVMDLTVRSITLITFVFALCLCWLYFRFPVTEKPNTTEKVGLWLLTGFLCFLLAVFPYVAVGKIPMLTNWDSRNQLLVSLGAGIILYFGSGLLFKITRLSHKIRVLILFLLVSVFVQMNVNNYLDAQREWYKQLSLIENFKVSEVMKKNTTFLFKDNCPELNFKRLNFAFYEYTGQMKRAFGDEKRFGQYWSLFNNHDQMRIYETEWYNMGQYKPVDPEYIVNINKGNYELTRTNTLRLKYYEIFRPQVFREYINQLINLEYEEL